MGKDVCSGPLGDVGVGEEILSNARSPRVSRTWGLLPLIPSGPELLRVAPPRIVVRHCRLGMGVASTQIPGRNTDTGRSRDKGCLAARMPDVHFLYTFQGGPSPTRNCYLRACNRSLEAAPLRLGMQTMKRSLPTFSCQEEAPWSLFPTASNTVRVQGAYPRGNRMKVGPLEEPEHKKRPGSIHKTWDGNRPQIEIWVVSLLHLLPLNLPAA